MDLTQRMAVLSSEQRRILEEKLVKSNIGILQLPIPPIKRDRASYPLSFGQERLWFIDQLDRGNSAYNLVRVSRLEGHLEPSALEKSLNVVIDRHEILRTSFIIEDGKPVQVIHPKVSISLTVMEMQSLDSVARESEIRRLTKRESLFPFDLTQSPLLRAHLLLLSPGLSLLILIIHHIIADGASIQLFIREVVRNYQAFTEEEGVVPMVESSTLQYIDYVYWQRHWLNTAEGGGLLMKKQEAYWLEQFRGEIPVLNLPIDFPRPALQSFEGASVDFSIGFELFAGLKGILKQENLTMYILLLSIFNLFLARISGMDDIVVGSPIACRRHPKLQDMMGMFVNTLALRNFPSSNLTLHQFFSDVKQRTLQAFENQEYRYEDIIARVSVNRDTSRNPLFDVMFLLKNLDYAKVSLPGLILVPQDYEKKTSMFDLVLSAFESSDTLLMSLDYCTKLFMPDTVGRFVNYLKTIIHKIALMESLDIPVRELEYIPEEEKKRVLHDFNDTRANFPENITIMGLFLNQAKQTPQAVAVSSKDARLTYEELEDLSARFATGLRAKGLKKEEIVVVAMSRCVELIISLFGILRAGGAYLPIDALSPRERIDYLVTDANICFYIQRADFDNYMNLVPDSSCLNYSDSNSAAYVIYTSGSTGVPKGVLIAHRSLVNRLHWMQNNYPLSFSDVILQKTTVTFDVSVWELFWWSMTGASVHMLEPEGEKSPDAMIQAVEKYQVSVMHFVPSMLNVFLEYIAQSGKISQLASMRRVFASGEALAIYHAERFNQLLFKTNQTELVNLYGPTEATVDVSFFNCSPMGSQRIIPIGRPIDNTRLFILDEFGFPQGVGISGELCIAGVQLSQGYLNRPELTSEKFIYLPVYGSQFEPILLYRTGDLARWLPDGNIEFQGRIDFQVKIRGFRIELGEIECCMTKIDVIRDAVVISRRDNNQNDYLCAYYTLHRENTEISVLEIRQFLGRILPDYMIPSFFIQLPEFPLTSSNKVNRKALPEPDSAGFYSKSVFLAPQSELELIIAEQWKKVLNVTRVGLNDNFFELGGNSLNIIHLNTELQKALNRDIPVVSLYRHLTIRSFASWFMEQDSGLVSRDAINKQEQKEKQLQNAKMLFKQAVNKTIKGKYEK